MERTPARLLAGGPIASEIRQAVAEDVATFRAVEGRPPGLAIVIVDEIGRASCRERVLVTV